MQGFAQNLIKLTLFSQCQLINTMIPSPQTPE